METLPALETTVAQVIEALNNRDNITATDLQRVATQPVRYASDFAFATVKTAEGDIGLLFDAHGGGGTIRRTPVANPARAEEVFPWTIGAVSPSEKGGRMPADRSEKSTASGDLLRLNNSLSDRLKESIPDLLRVRNLPAGVVTVTSVPDLTFGVESAGRQWKVSYNSLKGSVTGQPLDAPAQPLSWRRFLTRMHLSHGYPMSSSSTKWFWAIGADAIALVMIYWGGSGLIMWWQIKSTRRWGLALLVLSAVLATGLAVGMHGDLQGR